MAYELTAEQMKIADNTYKYHQGDSNQSMRAACAAVLESATEPGAALSDAEWKALYQEFSRRNINAILAQRRVLKGAGLPSEHSYISTACFHGIHDRCRQECKFCATKCGCTCGHPAPVSDPAPAQTKGDGETAHRMAQAYMNIPIGRRDERWIAVLQVAREGYWSAEAIEEAIANAWIAMCQHNLPDLIRSVRQRLSAPAAKTPEGKVSLRDCPPGLFLFRGSLGFKSEYGQDAYVVESGEFFWGGTSTHEERLKLEVKPITSAELATAPAQDAQA